METNQARVGDKVSNLEGMTVTSHAGIPFASHILVHVYTELAAVIAVVDGS